MKANLLPMAIFFFILFLNVTPSNCQIEGPNKFKDYHSLNKKIHILTFFVNTDEGNWEWEAVESQYAELLKSQRWLKNESKKWNQSLKFDNDYFFLENKSIVYLENMHLRSNPRVVLQKIINEIDFISFQEYLMENEFDKEKEKLKVVVFVNSSDSIHSHVPWALKEMDIVIINCDQNSPKTSDQYTISHELLHQFGAWDLFYTQGKSQTRVSGKLAQKLYPNSIMINYQSKQRFLQIDEVTAWRIGWNDWKKSYNEFDPFLNQEKIKEEGFMEPINENLDNLSFENNKTSGKQ